MTLRETVLRLKWLSDTATVFAERVDGQFVPQSRVEVLELTDSDMDRPISEVVKEKAPGTEYFLEVNLMNELIEDLQERKQRKDIETNLVVAWLIHYAEHDAYPEHFPC